jgi:predicted acylesterase/phospholipase RssA
MATRTHVVLGGGAAMGAFQAGAVLALFGAAPSAP